MNTFNTFIPVLKEGQFLAFYEEATIATGCKHEYYTLWETQCTGVFEKMEDGSLVLIETTSVSRQDTFIQNLSKDRAKAIAKCKELGYHFEEWYFDFELKHLSKPSFVAFGATMKQTKNKNKWHAEATKDFFEIWKSNKDNLKKLGWSLWKYENTWYMGQDKTKIELN